MFTIVLTNCCLMLIPVLTYVNRIFINYEIMFKFVP